MKKHRKGKMTIGAVDERESADATPLESLTPCKQQMLELEAESEPVKKRKLLRDTKSSHLFPTKDTSTEPEPHTEGSASAAPFVKKLWRQHLNKPLSSQQKEKFFCWEYKFFIGKVDDPIVDYYNQVGSTLSSDLSYGDFCSLVFAKLRWGDTEYEGFSKAIELKNRHYPKMTDLLIPCVLHDWTTYHNDLYRYERLIDLHYELWNKVEQGGTFPEVLSELKHKEYASIECDGLEHDFHSISNYVSRRRHEITWGKTVLFQIAEYFVKMKPVKLSDRGYSLYVKKKIKKATQLGIIKKEDVDLGTFKYF